MKTIKVVGYTCFGEYTTTSRLEVEPRDAQLGEYIRADVAKRLYEACKEMVADLNDRIGSGARFNPGTTYCIEQMEDAIAEADADD